MNLGTNGVEVDEEAVSYKTRSHALQQVRETLDRCTSYTITLGNARQLTGSVEPTSMTKVPMKDWARAYIERSNQQYVEPGYLVVGGRDGVAISIYATGVSQNETDRIAAKAFSKIR